MNTSSSVKSNTMASLNTIDESECKIELHEQSSCRTPSVINTKRPLSDSSSLSSPLHVSKKPNLENSSEAQISSPVITDPFSPSASELIDSEFQELITSTITTDSLVHNVIARIVDNALKEKFKKQEEEISFLQGVVDSLISKVNKLEAEVERQNHTSDSLEQYSRRHSVRIINSWPEQPNEDTDLKVVEMARECLNINISKEDIDRSHRVGRPRKNKPRPIIAKFVSYKTKSSIYKAKNKLKFTTGEGQKIHINEDLTKTRLSVFQKALKLKKDNLIADTWTSDGNIFVKDRSLRTHVFGKLDVYQRWENDLKAHPPLLYSEVASIGQNQQY